MYCARTFVFKKYGIARARARARRTENLKVKQVHRHGDRLSVGRAATCRSVVREEQCVLTGVGCEFGAVALELADVVRRPVEAEGDQADLTAMGMS